MVKAIETGAHTSQIVVTNAVNGFMEAWTVIPTDDLKYLNRQRQGELIYAR